MKLCHMDKSALKIKEMKFGWKNSKSFILSFCHKVFFLGLTDKKINPV